MVQIKIWPSKLFLERNIPRKWGFSSLLLRSFLLSQKNQITKPWFFYQDLIVSPCSTITILYLHLEQIPYALLITPKTAFFLQRLECPMSLHVDLFDLLNIYFSTQGIPCKILLTAHMNIQRWKWKIYKNKFDLIILLFHAHGLVNDSTFSSCCQHFLIFL